MKRKRFILPLLFVVVVGIICFFWIFGEFFIPYGKLMPRDLDEILASQPKDIAVFTEKVKEYDKDYEIHLEPKLSEDSSLGFARCWKDKIQWYDNLPRKDDVAYFYSITAPVKRGNYLGSEFSHYYLVLDKNLNILGYVDSKYVPSFSNFMDFKEYKDYQPEFIDQKFKSDGTTQ